MAAWVIQQCVIINAGIGGFTTSRLDRLISYVTRPQTNLAHVFPANSAFLTVKVASLPDNTPEPGDYDPAIPLAIAAWETNTWTANTPQQRSDAASAWTRQAELMTRGGPSQTWWDIPSSTTADEMTYECDSGLGSPSVTDCAQVEWQQLGPVSDTLAVGPGSTQFLHSGTCYVAISAIKSVVLSWEQIRTTITTLMNICVQHPFQPVQGGRAYYGLTKAQSSNGRKLRRRDSATVSGWSALPPPANITLFQQVEAFTDSAAELVTCTWKAVLRGLPVKTCTT